MHAHGRRQSTQEAGETCRGKRSTPHSLESLRCLVDLDLRMVEKLALSGVASS